MVIMGSIWIRVLSIGLFNGQYVQTFNAGSLESLMQNLKKKVLIGRFCVYIKGKEVVKFG